jgi:hypothetical protein
LAYCARVQCNATDYQQIAQKAAKVSDWELVPTQAEAHGVAPLLYTHLQAAEVQLPPATKQTLQGLYLRHRVANQVKMRVLSEIVSIYDAAGIQAVVLKGAALSHLIYPQVGLRPMRDLDILVKKSQALPAQELLAKAGFHAPLPKEVKWDKKHLNVANLQIEGLLISVEIHHNLFDDDAPVAMQIENLTSPLLSFSLSHEGLTAYTLGYEDMLWHICQHLILHGTVFRPTRLIWIADLVTFAEHFVTEIDWQRIKEQYPVVLNLLSLAHFMTPLSERVLNHAPLKIGQAPEGIGLHFQGWPHSSLANQKEKGFRGILRDSFFPSEWWLRLHYGLDSEQSRFYYRWVRHPIEISGWIMQLLRTRLEERLPKRNYLRSQKDED